MRIHFILLLLITAWLSVTTPSWCQVSEASDLFRQIHHLDSVVFERGFNLCLLDELEPIIADDLEFYHDQSGFSEGKSTFMSTLRQNICANPGAKPLRKLVAGTIEVFPLYSNGALYGAIQHGQHEFWIKEPSKEAYKTSVARFTHVWIRHDQEGWQLKRVLSYDHQR